MWNKILIIAGVIITSESEIKLSYFENDYKYFHDMMHITHSKNKKFLSTKY